MATPVYTTDLVDIIADTSTTTAWSAIGGGASQLSVETDYYIQGTACVSKQAWGSGEKGMIYTHTAGITVPSNGAVMFWFIHADPNSLDVIANGGVKILIGSSSSAYRAWYMAGNDTVVYGGWTIAAIDPSITANTTTGSPSGTLQYFGGLANLTAGPTKGNPWGIDAIRYGRTTLTCTNGQSGAYASFGGNGTDAGAAAYDAGSTRRWGQLILREGAYYMQGFLSLGSSGTAVDFRDSNRTIFIRDTFKVTSAFNRIEELNASSNVEWTSISITALGTTSPGTLVITAGTFAATSCTFTDMGTFTFNSTSTLTNTTFRRCDLVTQTSATFTGCTFDNSIASASILCNNVSNLDGCTFNSDGSNHAIQISATGSHNLTNHTFTSYATTDGSTGNEVIYNNSGGAVTLNASGNTGTISVRNGAGASTTIVQSVTVSFHVENSASSNVQNAQVYIQKSASGKSWNYTSAAGNSAGNTSFVVTGSIDIDLPQSGWLHILDDSANQKQNYRYQSWSTSTDTTFTLNTTVTGSATSTGSSTSLISTSTNFLTADIEEGDTIRNTTDGSWAVIDEIVDADNITTTPLQGGSDNTWTSSDGFSLHTLAIAYASGVDIVDIPIFNGQTNSSGNISTSYNYGALSTPLPVKIRIRSNEGSPKYVPYETSGTITSSGFSGTAVLTTDSVAT